MIIEKEIGTGSESVYVYYNKNDKQLALLQNRNKWECKIGFTVGNPEFRILQQTTHTSMSSKPIIGLIIKTQWANYAESEIHKAFTASKINAPGNEWFLTSPKEIEAFWMLNKHQIESIPKHGISLPQINTPKPKSKELHMQSKAITSLPIPTKYALKKLGSDICDARRRRRISTVLMASRAMISRTTLVKVEKGDPGVSIGIYATVLFILGMSNKLADLVDPTHELDITTEALPKRIRN